MPYLTVGARRYPLPAGETTLGGADGDIPLAGAEAGAPLAAVTREGEDRVFIRRLRADAALLLDGEPVAGEPRRLVHGAKIEVAGRTIFYGDARRSAGTEQVAGVGDDARSALDAAIPPGPAADSNGRLVALADGRTWSVPDDGLEIGRDPACDVVVDSPDASRWHAAIARTILGYVVRDASSNGVFVNGARVDEARPLTPGDVLRIGRVEFRFEADETPLEAPLPAAGPPDGRAAGAARDVPRVEPSPLLATLEIVNEGIRKGERIRIEREPVRIGRSSRLEVVFADDSVSGLHATLERRDGAWTVVDHESTNGSYADGERFLGARRLTGAVELRFGNVKVLFRPIAPTSVRGAAPPPPAGAAPGETGSTRGIVGLTEAQLRRQRARADGDG